MKQIIKLNESQLRKVVAESVKKVLEEGVNHEIIDAMKKYLSATRNLRTLFSAEDVEYVTSQQISWEDMLSNIEKEIARFLVRGCL